MGLQSPNALRMLLLEQAVRRQRQSWDLPPEPEGTQPPPALGAARKRAAQRQGRVRAPGPGSIPTRAPRALEAAQARP